MVHRLREATAIGRSKQLWRRRPSFSVQLASTA
jgi:hypothetical protein